MSAFPPLVWLWLTFSHSNLGAVNVLAVNVTTLAVSQLLTSTSPIVAPTGLVFVDPWLYSMNANYLLKVASLSASHYANSPCVKTDVDNAQSIVVASSPLFRC
jgi:hypothetical protein